MFLVTEVGTVLKLTPLFVKTVDISGKLSWEGSKLISLCIKLPYRI